MKEARFKSVSEYISMQPAKQKALLKELRYTIITTAPGAEELISYNMPALRWNGMLVWYAAFKGHIGFYPKPSAIKAFSKDLRNFKTSKGAIQFDIQKRMPVALVKKIVKYRMKENLEKAAVAGVK